MGNRFLVGVLFVVVGILAGVSLLVSISVAINTTMAPMAGKLHEIVVSQKNIEQKISQGTQGADNETIRNLYNKVALLESKISMLEQRSPAMAQDNAGAQMPPQPPSEDFEKVYDLQVSESPNWGKKDAPVTIVEILDFQCPFCSRFHPPILEVLKAYPNEVNYVIKNFPLPFHPQARPAAKAALAAGEQGKFYEMADLLLENSQNLNDDKFKELAGTLGLNVDKFVRDYKEKDAEWEKRIQMDMTLAQEVDFQGTPTFYINGRKVKPNVRDFKSWKMEIDSILKR